MRSFHEWLGESAAIQAYPWLILGKGPSFEKVSQYDLSGYKLMTLNHAIDKVKVDVAHMIDLDVVDACQQSIDENAAYLVMPWVPHQDNKPGQQTLAELIKMKPILAKLSSENRLLFYNHLAEKRNGDSPLVRVRYFSSEAAINLLAGSGVKVIRTLGVDGGASYSQSFSHLTDVTLLVNGRKSFNKQFDEIARTIMETGIDFSPLDLQSPVKVYVATTEAQMLAVKVLEYSIRKHASMSIEVIPLHHNNIEVPQPKNPDNWPRTPFSFQRFLIPELQGYKGRAIYVDSDMQVFKDIKDLWTRPFNGAEVLTVKNFDETVRRPQFSVMLLNCDALRWQIKDIVAKLDSGELDYTKLMYEMKVANNTDAVEYVWNSLERYEEDKTALLHYTDMDTQPWISRLNPLGYLWFRDLFEAIDKGFITKEYVQEHIQLGYIRPSVMYQIEHRIEDSLLLPAEGKNLDANYKAPFQSLVYGNQNTLKNLKLVTVAKLRKILKLSGWYTLKRKVKNRLSLN